MKKLIFILMLLLAAPMAFAENQAPVVSATASSEAPAGDASASNIGEAVFISENLKLMPKIDKEQNAEQSYTIDVTYPQIEGENLPANAKQFNKLISDMANHDVQQFKKYVAADQVHMKTLPPEIRKNSLHMDYDIDVVKPSGKTLISVRLTVEGMQAGRAHPYHNHQVLNYDFSTSKVLALSDLFKAKAKYLNLIATEAKQRLNGKLEDKWMIAEGTKPLAKNFKNWNLENDGIVFTFDEYQVAPYVNGAQEVEIPYTALKAIISPKATIYPCVQNSAACALVKAKS